MLVLTNYKEQGHGKSPLLSTLPHKSTQSTRYEGRTGEFYFRSNLATVCLTQCKRWAPPAYSYTSSRKPTQHLRSANRSQVHTTHKYRTFNNETPVCCNTDWVANEETLEVLERQFDDLIPHILDYNYTVPKEIRKEVTDHIRQHYFRGQPVSKSIKQIIKVYASNYSTFLHCRV
jgi:hypothetical protein